MFDLADLTNRIARLDREPGNPTSDIAHFVSVISRFAGPGTPGRPDRTVVSPSDADALAAESALLRRIERVTPDIVAGPLSAAAQSWISTGKPSHRPPGEREPSERHFIPAFGADLPPSAKPFDVGMFTSTGVPSMWRVYLDLHGDSALYPRPWWTWSVTAPPDVDVYEIDGAARWVDLVTCHPVRHDGLLYPDWAAIARRFDAVHITMRAIAAAQGMFFSAPDGPVVAPFWDVESTFWLRWRFTATELVQR